MDISNSSTSFPNHVKIAANTNDRFDDSVARLIREKARRLVGRHGYTRADRSDLEQELSLHVIRAFAVYQPARSNPCTFANRVIDNKAIDLARQSRRQLQLQRLGEGFYPPTDVYAADRALLILDVQHLVAGLPQELRKVALLLMEANESEVARRCNYSRQRVRTLRGQLARHLRSLDPRRRRVRRGFISLSRATQPATA